jgi:hypothetical protein
MEDDNVLAGIIPGQYFVAGFEHEGELFFGYGHLRKIDPDGRYDAVVIIEHQHASAPRTRSSGSVIPISEKAFKLARLRNWHYTQSEAEKIIAFSQGRDVPLSRWERIHLMLRGSSGGQVARPSDLLKWILLLLPCIVIIPAIVGAREFAIVLRDETIHPIVGTPRSLVALALVSFCMYFLMAASICRKQVLNPGQALGLILLLWVMTPFSVIAVGQALNGYLDTHAPQQHRAKVQGLHRMGGKQYGKVQDWHDSAGHVLLPNGPLFIMQNPEGSMATVVTKPGFFGYEHLIEVIEPPFPRRKRPESMRREGL